MDDFDDKLKGLARHVGLCTHAHAFIENLQDIEERVDNLAFP